MKVSTPLLASLALALGLAGCGQRDERVMVGTLERDRIELSAESNEPIARIMVSDGETVQAGQPVLEQDDARQRARLAQTQAQRDQATARLAELRRGPRQEAIREAQARLEASQAVTVNARETLARARDIFERGLSNQAELDDADAAWKAARAREQADHEVLASLLHGTTVEELQQAEAALEALQAQVRQAEIDLQRLQVRAPMDGVVDRVLYEPGERPAPGATVAVLLDQARMYARIYVPEHLRARITPGARLELRIDHRDGWFDGHVRWVSSDATFTPYFALTEHDRSRLSYLAEVDLAATDLPTGLPVEARLPIEAMD
ncbi:MAG: HlyD family efflux transporter periplasmic adaptor subunit [Xanthomonadales bacterium]|nr:HlyD family efflux transporter periplasmic adaptor subunit [Xanthomonadales bacterium]NIN59822.1 HlyD family efflux transporter periplasmic adaptor subunit [Xanthomonadales bacterium]NIN75197.1 HlyD family efflux transporter periplasmic adaptor subunit [Xanthomonadales bacterium]NIO14174.1 HlyD family efflux transporter periplasmic adaptor subunit [Xanthomonadales bacterium]NIP12215.1 HlyD family efflux transporter periplasmic adaptor subunit [Xanthomonadales bacterium]